MFSKDIYDGALNCYPFLPWVTPTVSSSKFEVSPDFDNETHPFTFKPGSFIMNTPNLEEIVKVIHGQD